mgnify:CR=1 FL=1
MCYNFSKKKSIILCDNYSNNQTLLYSNNIINPDSDDNHEYLDEPKIENEAEHLFLVSINLIFFYYFVFNIIQYFKHS